MSFDTNYGWEITEVSCDYCSEVIEVDETDWSGVAMEIKELGWRIKIDKRIGEWVHICPSCREKMNL